MNTSRVRTSLLSPQWLGPVVLILFSACESTGPTSPTKVYSLAPDQPTLFVGMSVRLEPGQAAGGDAPAGPVKWLSSNESIVTVDATGLITGVAAGTASIKALTDAGYAETPVMVVVGGGSIRTSYLTTCGITSTGGALYCWGLNSRGQTGIGNSVSPQLSPAKVNGGLSFTTVTLGAEHVCGMTMSGPYCWGASAGNQVSDGLPVADPVSPVKVRGGEIFVAIEANGSFFETGAFCSDATCGGTTCGLTSGGDPLCWNALYNSPTPLAPVPVTGAPRVKALSLGMAHACGIDLNDGLWCWGQNLYRQSALPTVSSPAPHRVAPELAFQAVSAGRGHTCAIEISGDAYCWGSNSNGQLGAPSSETCSLRFVQVNCRSTPVKVEGGYKFQAISAGSASPVTTEVQPSSHTCGITVAQAIVCWGSNSSGQLGDGTTTDRATPTKVATTLKFRSVATGLAHTCAVAVDGTGYCWGANNFGQLGMGTTSSSSTPVGIAGGLSFK